MLILLPILILLVASIAVTGLQFWRPKAGVAWLVSALVALITWLGCMVLRLRIPDSLSFGLGESTISFSILNILVLDKISWPYAWAISTCLVGFILTSVANLTPGQSLAARWSTWPVGLTTASLALWAIFAGNLNTLIMAWAAMDLFVLVYMVVKTNNTRDALFGFAIRVVGLYFAVAALFAVSAGTTMIFPLINKQANTLLFLGAMLRLASIEFGWEKAPAAEQNLGMHTFMNIAVAATSLIVLARCASTGISETSTTALTILAALIALVNGLRWWLFRQDIHVSRYWMIGMAALAATAAMRGEVEASLAWGIALILSGSLLFFSIARSRLTNALLVAGLLGFLALPFTPAWQAIRIYPTLDQLSQESLWWIANLLALALLVAGYILSMSRARPSLEGAERWTELIYPVGLFIFPVTQITILIFGLPGLSNDLQAFPELNASWISAPMLALAALAYVAARRAPRQVSIFSGALGKFRPYEWFVSAFQASLNLFVPLVRLINQILEGEGGILWTLLFLLLLLAILLQFGGQG